MNDPLPAAATTAWQSAMSADSAEEAFEHVAGLEQVFADAGVGCVEKMRRIAAGFAGAAYGSHDGCAVACRAALSKIAVPPVAPRTARLKTAETLSHFGVVPSDAFAVASGVRSRLDLRDAVVVGVRTAGSYLAPPVAAALDLETYVTVRPMGNGLVEEPGLEESLRNRRCVVIVDEGPGTGFTFRTVVRAVRRLATNARLIVFHTRPAALAYLGGPDHSVLIEPRAFQTALHGLLLQLPCEQTIAPMASNPLSLRGYESPKALLGGRYVAKFIGWGSLGRRRLAAWRALQPYVPPPAAFQDGVIAYEFIERSKKGIDGSSLIAGYFHRLAETTGMERVPACEILETEMEWLSGLSDADWPIGSGAVSRSELGQLRASGWSYVVDADWKLESAKWLIADGRVRKLDPFHCHDYADYPRADVAVEIAGAAIELGLSDAAVRRLVHTTEHLFGIELSPALLRGGELAYLHWKIAAYSHCLGFLRHHCVSSDAMERQRKRLQAARVRFHRQNAAGHAMGEGARQCP